MLCHKPVPTAVFCGSCLPAQPSYEAVIIHVISEFLNVFLRKYILKPSCKFVSGAWHTARIPPYVSCLGLLRLCSSHLPEKYTQVVKIRGLDYMVGSFLPPPSPHQVANTLQIWRFLVFADNTSTLLSKKK